MVVTRNAHAVEDVISRGKEIMCIGKLKEGSQVSWTYESSKGSDAKFVFQAPRTDVHSPLVVVMIFRHKQARTAVRWVAVGEDVVRPKVEHHIRGPCSITFSINGLLDILTEEAAIWA